MFYVEYIFLGLEQLLISALSAGLNFPFVFVFAHPAGQISDAVSAEYVLMLNQERVLGPENTFVFKNGCQ